MQNESPKLTTQDARERYFWNHVTDLFTNKPINFIFMIHIFDSSQITEIMRKNNFISRIYIAATIYGIEKCPQGYI